VRTGRLGRILKVVVEYPQGYAITALEQKGDGAISNWRMDPNVAGVSNCMGDIGTHAENLARYITGLSIDEICADLSTFIPGRPLDDDGNCLVRFKGGAKGILFASQISSGDENNLNIRVWGTKGSLQWFQEHPNELIFKAVDQPQQIFRRGNNYLTKVAQENSRTPFGHQEAFIEAFANVYRGAAIAIADAVAGRKPPKGGYDFPNIDDGVEGMAFIETVVKSAQRGAKWVKFPELG
jgi:predicted dehydrogenase